MTRTMFRQSTFSSRSTIGPIRAMVGAVLVPILVAASPLSTSAGEHDSETGRSIFNGKNLDGWKGDRAYWRVEEGQIVGRTTADHPLPHNTFLIWEGKLPGDFELHLQYKIDGTQANSGVQYRSRRIPDAGPFVVGGYQADIDATLRYTGILYDERGGRGILAERGQRVTIDTKGKRHVETFARSDELARSIHRDGWNRYRIVARGPRLQHYINGKLMVEVVDRQTGKSSRQGILALQLHRGPPMVVRFKDLRLKRLAAPAKGAPARAGN